MLRENELGRRETREKFGLKTKYRVLPRQFGEYRGEKFFEVEEVCIETNTMPYEAYNRSIRLSLISSVFSTKLLDPLRQHIFELGLSYYEFLVIIHRDLEDENILSPLHEICKNFSFESESELFESCKGLAFFAARLSTMSNCFRESLVTTYYGNILPK